MSFFRRLANVAKGSWLSYAHDDPGQKARQDLLDKELGDSQRPLSPEQIDRLRAQDRERARHPGEPVMDGTATLPRRPVEFDDEGNVKKTL